MSKQLEVACEDSLRDCIQDGVHVSAEQTTCVCVCLKIMLSQKSESEKHQKPSLVDFTDLPPHSWTTKNQHFELKGL